MVASKAHIYMQYDMHADYYCCCAAWASRFRMEMHAGLGAPPVIILPIFYVSYLCNNQDREQSRKQPDRRRPGRHLPLTPPKEHACNISLPRKGNTAAFPASKPVGTLVVLCLMRV